MKHRAKYLLVVIVMLISLSAIGAQAAALPGDWVIICDRAYSLEFFMEPENLPEIQQAIDNAMIAGCNIYYKLSGVADNPTNALTLIEASDDELNELSVITYTDEQGNTARYDFSTGEKIEGTLSKAIASVEHGALSLKRISIKSTTVEDAAKFMVQDSTQVAEIGEEIAVIPERLRLTVFILCEDENVLAAGELAVGLAGESISFYVFPLTEVTGVELNKDTVRLEAGGDPTRLHARITPVHATNREVLWTSSDPDVASVEGGIVTPLIPGTTVVTVTSVEGGFTSECLVTVYEKQTAFADVKIGALSFTGITIASTNVEDAAKFKVEGSTSVEYIGGEIIVLGVASNITVYILDAEENVLAEGKLDISSSGSDVEIRLE